jgi:lipopolysaccharide export system protein LptC
MTHTATVRSPDARLQTTPTHGARAHTRASRVEAAFSHAQRHSRRVRVLKIVLPTLAVMATVGFFATSWLATPLGVSFDLGATAIEDGRIVMSDPRLDGFTGNDRPYSMAASRAMQDLGNTNIIDLEGIEAKLPFDDANWVNIAAKSGTLDRTANTLNLNDKIELSTDTGITAVLQSAKVDFRGGNLDSDTPVDITLSGARIEADSFQVRDRGAVMIFDKRVRMEIEPQRLQTAKSGEGGANEN